MSRELVALGCLFIGGMSAGEACGQQGGSDSWPQWRGVNRDGHASGQGYSQDWNAKPPKLAWTYRDAGEGFSATAVVDGRLYAMGGTEKGCEAICISAVDGSEVWRQVVGPTGAKGDYLDGWGAGPRGTPAVADGKVYVQSDLGLVACLDARDGTVQWSVDIAKEFGGTLPKWGYSESPLVDGDRVMVTPGGSNFMVGLSIADGSKVWSSQGINDTAHYASIIKHEVDGAAMYLTASEAGLVGLSVSDGRLLFRNEHTANNVAVCPTPLAWDNYVYHTSNYGAGNVLVKLAIDGDKVDAEEVYALKSKSMQNHHGGVVMVDGAIFGFSKDAGWMCQDALTGETLWNNRMPGTSSGSICVADGMLYCYNDSDGACYLVVASKTPWSNKGKIQIPEQSKMNRKQGRIWTHPVVAEGKLFLRDLDLIFAFDLK
jgi:outer membrane protein assembly factor BamB